MATSNLSTPQLSNSKITQFDIQDYRNKLSTVLGGNTGGMSTVPNMTPVPKTTTITPTVSSKTPVVTPTTTPAPTPAPTPVAGGGSYTVKAGDSLSKIASQNGLSLQQLLDLNPTYKQNPNLVQIGASISLGTKSPSPTPTPANPANPQLTPEQIAKQESDDLAKKAGEAGLSIQEYQAVLDRQNYVSKDESDKLAKELGIPTVEGELFAKPSKSSEQLYQDAYASSGLADIKTKINALNDEIARERANLAEAIGQIDENPFLTEVSRVGRGKRLLEQAEQRINNKLAQVTQYQTLYDTGINEINNMVTRNQNDFNTNQTINTAKLNYLQKKLEQQVGQLGDKKKGDAMGSLSSYLGGVSSGKAPTVIGNSESGFYKYDPTTKKFVQVVGQSAKTTAEIKKINSESDGGGGTFKPRAEDVSLVNRFANSTEGVKLGFTEADKARLKTDQNFFYWALQKANESGFY